MTESSMRLRCLAFLAGAALAGCAHPEAMAPRGPVLSVMPDHFPLSLPSGWSVTPVYSALCPEGCSWSTTPVYAAPPPGELQFKVVPTYSAPMLEVKP